MTVFIVKRIDEDMYIGNDSPTVLYVKDIQIAFRFGTWREAERARMRTALPSRYEVEQRYVQGGWIQ